MMEQHVSTQSSSYNSPNFTNLSSQRTSYQQFAQWLRRHLEKLKTPTDPRSAVEILSGRLGITGAFAQLLLSGYVRPNATLMEKLLQALPGIPAKRFNQQNWAFEDDIASIRFMDAPSNHENQETKSNKSNGGSNDLIENNLPIKLRGLCG